MLSFIPNLGEVRIPVVPSDVTVPPAVASVSTGKLYRELRQIGM